MHEAPSVLSAWSNYYVITGSAAAALTGLMFVVMTLIAGNRTQSTGEAVATYNTPTVVHFSCSLLVSATLSAPWHSLLHAGLMLGLIGLYGTAYVIYIMYRTRRVSTYRAQMEDLLWHVALPLVAYVAIVAGAILLPSVPTEALFALAGGNVLLIFIGIHNAWDVVTYIAVDFDPNAEGEVIPASQTPVPPNASGSDEPPPVS